MGKLDQIRLVPDTESEREVDIGEEDGATIPRAEGLVHVRSDDFDAEEYRMLRSPQSA